MAPQKGLTTEQVKVLQEQFGKNEIEAKKQRKPLSKIAHIFSEPIYGLLLGAATIYFLLGEMVDGILMIAFVIFVIGLDLLQEARTGNALKKLKELSAPRIKVIRDGRETLLPSTELVPGDIMLISEGVKIPADGRLIYTNGLCVDESILTGEAEGVWKCQTDKRSVFEGDTDREYFRKDYCYTGTMVVLGNGTVVVEKIGTATEYGQIADKLKKERTLSSPLNVQMRRLAKQCTLIAGVLLFLVSLTTYLNLEGYPLKQRLIESFLAGVVLALSMVPGEFPVIQTVFLSMGALRLAKKHALIRRLPAVEALGAVSVLCVDKTGTITKNHMEVQEFWYPDFEGNGLCRAIALACKEDTYDPMELAMLKYCGIRCIKGKLEADCIKACVLTSTQGKFIREYPFTNERKAMGQVWQFDKEIIIAVKGSFETVLPLCVMSAEQEQRAREKAESLARQGLRVIAVAEQLLPQTKTAPDHMMDCRLILKGLVGLSDPPRENIDTQIKACYQAGIRLIMITGDHPKTAAAVAEMVGIREENRVVTGDEISKVSDQRLREIVKTCNIFARVLPVHKMRIVKALKDNGEVTAMTGDGVNDSPALKIADIGVAMGQHGSEVCREAADLILLDDNLQTILDSVKDGRRIYQNILKAVGYVLAIHIPIALISLTAPLLQIPKDALMLLPLHIVLLELVMDPTCSVALERQPAEENIMRKPPRKPTAKLLSAGLFIKSMVQGLVIFAVSFISYLYLWRSGASAELARTFGYSILVLSNIFLVLVNCSDREAFLPMVKKLRKERGIWLLNIIILLELVIIIYTPAAGLLQFTPLSLPLVVAAFLLAFLSVIWFEAVKWFIRRKGKCD